MSRRPTLHLLPIEPMEARYSADWMRWWPKELARLGVEHRVHLGRARAGAEIETGEFLDVIGTNVWKSTQLVAFAEALHFGEVRDGDVVLLHDGWNPAVEQLAYMRDTGNVKFRIALMLHAGTWDRHDFLSKRGMRGWGQYAEAAWARIADRILFATEFHRDLFLNSSLAIGSRAKTAVTGFPLYAEELARYRKPWNQRERLVVFPHRLADEKQPHQFDELRALYEATYPHEPRTLWLRTKDMPKLSKEEYYATLGEARVVVSTALQETWGIAMLEGVACGAIPVAPDRLSYPETLGEDYQLYHSMEHAVRLIHCGLSYSNGALPAQSLSRWEAAIETIASDLGVMP